MYELLTGDTPFTGDTSLAVAYQRMDRDVAPPSTVIEGVPRQFDDLVACATSRDPRLRFADAAEMADQLDTDRAANSTCPTSGCPPPATRRCTTRPSAPTAAHGAHGTTVNLDRPTLRRTGEPAHQGVHPRRATTPGRRRQRRIRRRIPFRHRSIRRNRPGRVLLGAPACQAGTVLLGRRGDHVAALAAAGAWTLGANLSNLI